MDQAERFFEHYHHERNYGCRLREYVYRGLRTLSVENELLRVTLLLDKGTDIVEFLYKPLDLDVMWHSPLGIRSVGYTPTVASPAGSFLDYYAGGWQELFPNIGGGCTYQGAPLGTHGEVCLLPWELRVERDEPEQVSVRCRVRTVRSPYLLEKTLSMKSNDPTLYIEERVVNEGRVALQAMWGHHPAFGPLFLDGNCRLQVPQGCRARTDDRDLGPCAPLPRGEEFQWPSLTDAEGRAWDLSQVPAPDSRVYFMFYLHEIREGWYSLSNPKRGVAFAMRWDPKVFPVIAVWMPCGGALGYPWYGRSYCAAVEPWSALPPNLCQVAEEGRGLPLAGGQEITTRLEARIAPSEPELP
ncbi:MAG: DUF4432 family protein [Spirochaetales bacterium]|nr:DUF4432 family protein [Spirochaetales bacterium]